MERFAEGFQSAYCPKFEENRRLDIGLAESISLGNIRRYGLTYFNCPEFYQCEYVDTHNECPFAHELLSRFSRS